MTDTADPLLARVGRLSRRHLIGAVAGGALLGSAWAAELRDAVTAGSAVHVTVARTATALGVLFEHHGHRIMMLDAADGPGATAVTELSTGFMRPRIDALMLTSDAAASLPRDYRERWHVRDIWTLPDRRTANPSSLAGKELRIDNLTIAADVLPLGAWRADPPSQIGWYVAADVGRSRVFVASDGDAIERLPMDASMANAVVCNDVQLDLDAMPSGIDALVVPVEAASDIPEGIRAVALSRNGTVTVRLREDRIETP